VHADGAHTNEAYEYWCKQSENRLSSYILGNEGFKNVPEYADFIKDKNGDIKQWFELDDRGHFFGADPRHCNLKIDLEIEGIRKTAIDKDFRSAILRTNSKISTQIFSKELKAQRPSLIILSYEKGCFFEADFEVSGKQDFKNLIFKTVSINNSETFIYKLIKDTIEINSTSRDTTSKGIFFELAKF
jgi:hypothetical protein